MLRRIVKTGLQVARVWLSGDEETRVPDNAPFAYPLINALHVKITREAPSIVRPGYLWGSLHGAYLAKTLGFDSASLIEFGVAGGNGLVALELIAERIEHHLGVKISVFGFDTGKGLPHHETCGIVRTFLVREPMRWMLISCVAVFDELSLSSVW